MDKDGHLYIKGRIKELIITAGGENIAPLNIENTFRNFCSPVSNIMVIGDMKHYLSAFITFKVDVNMQTGVPTQNLTPEVKNFFKTQMNISVETVDDILKN